MTSYANRMDSDTNCGLDDTKNARPRKMAKNYTVKIELTNLTMQEAVWLHDRITDYTCNEIDNLPENMQLNHSVTDR